ncbi:MAG: hypothetical protein HKK67_01785 [Chlorobiaceae bacterium]|nr:hypothetical protein [Chlorobiaceae bacterium]
MKKNFFAALIVALALTPLFGGVTFAVENQASETKTVATTEVKAETPPAAEKNESKTDECCTVGELKPL